MGKFIFKVVLILLAFILLSLSLQKLTDKFMRHSKLLYFQTWNDIIESKIKSDLIIMGSSRAKVQFSPGIIDSNFNLNTCNLGMEGTGFDMQYCRFQLLVKNNKKPKYIIQNIDCTSTLLNNIYQIEQYIPYLNEEIIRDATFQTGAFDFKDIYIPLYKYTHTLFTKDIIVDGMMDYFSNQHGAGAYQNFAANDSSWDSSFSDFKSNNIHGFRPRIDTSSINRFKEFLEFCGKDGIKVILVYAPEYIELQHLELNRDSVINIYSTLAKKFNLPLLNYSGDTICLNTKYFYNSQHMNSRGVKIFNHLLAKDLKGIIE